MARTRTTNISGYWTKRHYTQPHKRTLNDSTMQLELAEGNEMLFYYQVPDPDNKQKPRFLIESETWDMPDEEFTKFIRYVTPFNKPEYLSRLIARRIAGKQRLGLNDDVLLSSFWKKAFGVVKNVFKGAVATVTGVQLPGGGTASVSTQPAVVNVPPPVINLPAPTPPASPADNKIFGLTPTQAGLAGLAVIGAGIALTRK